MMRKCVCLLAFMVLAVSLVSEVEANRKRHKKAKDEPVAKKHKSRAPDWPGMNFFPRRLQGGFKFGFPGPFRFDFDLDFGAKSWWEGPNVCQKETIENSTNDGVISHHFSASSQVCEESGVAYKCTTTIQKNAGKIKKVDIRECCYGYSRSADDFGCPELLNMTDLLTTARILGLNDLVRAVTTVGLDDELSRENFTLFAPSDGSFSPESFGLTEGAGITLQDKPHGALLVSKPMKSKMENELQAILLGHLLPKPSLASSFQDEDVLETGSPYGSTIRINFYSRPEKLTTANCVRVTSTDNKATNGVIHIVEKVLPTVTSSLMDIIQRDADFSSLKTVLARANLVQTLQKKGQFTLLAPTNSAFQRLDKALFDRLMTGESKCLQKVVEQHILPNVICSAVVQGRTKSPNLLENFINLTRIEDGKLFADNAQIIRSDVMATNGVMHVIDAVLIPSDALDMVSAAKKNGLTELIRMVDSAGMTSTLQSSVNITMFAPTNKAFKDLPAAIMQQLTSDPAMLRSVLEYHIVEGEATCSDLYNGRALDTLNSKGKIAVNEYSNFPFSHGSVQTVQCAPISVKNVPSCNVLIHVIDKVMLPPRGNVMDILSAESKYSTLVRLIKAAGLAEFLQAEGPFTIFAPTNEAFEHFDKDTLGKLQDNVQQLTNIIKRHVIQDNLCCAGIFRVPWWRHQRIAMMNDDILLLHRDHNNNPVISDSTVISCDNMATNGIVHGISQVLLDQPEVPWYMMFHGIR